MADNTQSNHPVEDASTKSEKKVKKSKKKKSSTPPPSPSKPPPPPEPWYKFVRTASDSEIKKRFSVEVKNIIAKYADELSNYCVLTLIDTDSSIGTWDLDKVFNALSKTNPSNNKDVLLLLLSSGGSIEPAYQISKLCKAYSKNKFIVSVPRRAKSAATLIAIGADEIHLGPLGQLGPIDPQLAYPHFMYHF